MEASYNQGYLFWGVPLIRTEVISGPCWGRPVREITVYGLENEGPGRRVVGLCRAENCWARLQKDEMIHKYFVWELHLLALASALSRTLDMGIAWFRT